MVERAVPGELEWPELSAQHVARYLFAADLARGKRILDAGCGTGYGSVILKLAGAADVLAVDIDPATVLDAARRYPASDVRFVTDDCHTLATAPGPFDLVVNFENIEHLTEPRRFLQAAAARLTEGGQLVISTPDRAATPPFVDGKPANPFHHFEWTRDEFRDLLAERFADVQMFAQLRSTASAARAEAVVVLKRRLIWANPIFGLLWKMFSRRGTSRTRSWKLLADLAASSPADFPIVRPELSGILGHAWGHVAICRLPRP